MGLITRWVGGGGVGGGITKIFFQTGGLLERGGGD